MKRILALLLLLTACQPSPNPKKQEAIASLLSVSTASDFPTYIERIASAKQAVSSYQSSGKADRDVLSKMQNALDTHVAAGSFWQCSLSDGDGVVRQCQTQQLKAIAEEHSVLKPYVNELKGQVSEGYAFNSVDKERVLGALWTEADKEVEAIK